MLTVFVAWLNLDLGLEACFYHEMDAYSQTWLQFLFPLYIWVVKVSLIVTSRYSVIMSRLIGSNPVAVLATLLLMSYTKFLRIIIEVYSYVKLDYPNNQTVKVWLKDANVPYLLSEHLGLTVVTSLFLAFFFLPYTLLLLTGHKLYRFAGRKHFRWFNRLRPLLDSYHAPYKVQTRFWTGLLLLVRCALYIVFSFNSIGMKSESLLAIVVTFTVVSAIAWLLSKGVYRKMYVDIMEASVYLNIIFLSAATLASKNSPSLVHTSVGIVFVTTIGIVVHHFSTLYIIKSRVWLKLSTCFKTRLVKVQKRWQRRPVSHSENNVAADFSSHDQGKFVTKTVLDLREPLLEMCD